MNLEGRDSEIIGIIFLFFFGNADKSHENFAIITDFWAWMKMEVFSNKYSHKLP